jgi:hypothetical protein
LVLLLIPLRLSAGAHFWQAAGEAVHVLLFAGLAWLVGRHLPTGLRGGVLWMGLAVFSAGMECLQPLVGRASEWVDWLYGAGGAACICATWQLERRVRIRWAGILILCLFPLGWELAMVRMEVYAFPVLADSAAKWSRRGWILNFVQLTPVAKEGFRVEPKPANTVEVSGMYPGLFRVPACSDWSEMQALRAELYWPSPVHVLFALRVDDRPGNPAYADRFQREFSVTQGWNLVQIPVAELGRTSGGRPVQLGAIRRWGVFLVSDRPFDYFLLGAVSLDLHQESP